MPTSPSLTHWSLSLSPTCPLSLTPASPAHQSFALVCQSPHLTHWSCVPVPPSLVCQSLFLPLMPLPHLSHPPVYPHIPSLLPTGSLVLPLPPTGPLFWHASLFLMLTSPSLSWADLACFSFPPELFSLKLDFVVIHDQCVVHVLSMNGPHCWETWDVVYLKFIQ